MSNEMENSAAEGIKVMTEFAHELYMAGLKDGMKYTVLGCLVGGTIMIVVDCMLDKRKKKSAK